MNFKDLPALGAALDVGTFAGVTTKPDGTHCAVILLPDRATGLTWEQAMAWAKNLYAELPTRPAAASLSANIKNAHRVLPDGLHWTSDDIDDTFAWYCHIQCGYQSYGHKVNYIGAAVAVRLIPLHLEGGE